MRRGFPRLLALLAAGVVTVGWAGAAAAGGRCGDQACRADVDISGHAEPQPIRIGETSQFKFTVKNDGPDGALGIYMQTVLPPELQLVRYRHYGGQKCWNEQRFIKCYLGDFRREQEAVVRIMVRPRKTGFYHVKAIEFDSDGTDPNGGNGQVTATMGVLKRALHR